MVIRERLREHFPGYVIGAGNAQLIRNQDRLLTVEERIRI